MAVILPTTNSAVIPEYAATQITFTRTMVVDANGHYQPNFSAQITYLRSEYIMDGEGNKTALVQPRPWTPPAPDPTKPYDAKMYQDPGNGFISLGQADMVAAGLMAATTDATVFGWLSEMADSLIRADLIKRGLVLE